MTGEIAGRRNKEALDEDTGYAHTHQPLGAACCYCFHRRFPVLQIANFLGVIWLDAIYAFAVMMLIPLTLGLFWRPDRRTGSALRSAERPAQRPRESQCAGPQRWTRERRRIEPMHRARP